MADMDAKYGTGKAKPESQPQPAPQPAPQPDPQPDPQPQQRGLIDNAMNLFGSRGKQIDKASGYRDGGKIQGPGTARSDSIDATVRETGEPIKVSNGERIVSAAQENVLQGIARGLGFDGLDALLEHGTGRPVGPTIKGGKRAAADGMSPEEKEWRLKTGNLMSEYPGKPSGIQCRSIQDVAASVTGWVWRKSESRRAACRA